MLRTLIELDEIQEVPKGGFQTEAEPTEGGESPDWVRLSMASAMVLRLRSGRFAREFEFGGINLLLNYDDGCRSDCAYCGLARSRPGEYDEKSFIRVEWPLVSTDEVVERMARYHDRLTRLCISMVTHKRSYPDTVDITRRIAAKVDTPISILVAPPTLNQERLQVFQDIGVDMIGIGLDAVTEDLFIQHRNHVPQGGGLKWEQYWKIIHASREVFGPWKVNCHILVGLGETDRDLVETFYRLSSRQIYSYLFCFNPEPDSRLGNHPKSSLSRWRRIQLLRLLIEERGLERDRLEFDEDGNLIALKSARAWIEKEVLSGVPFMTNGCPGPKGEPGCTRPYGSYKPSEPIRDFPFLPMAEDMGRILQDLRLEEILRN